jgi:CRP-like cAMP-binding protein
MQEYGNASRQQDNTPSCDRGNYHGEAALAACPVFRGLETAHYAGILAAARTREFARGEWLYMDGHPIKEVLLLTSGRVKITKYGENGGAAILGLGGPGDVLGAANLFSTGTHTTTAEPVQRCRALVWCASAFKAFVERFPILYPNLIRIHAEYLAQLEERFHEVATELVSRRVARQLVRLHEKTVQPAADQTEIRFSQEELAQMTGTTLFAVNRLLSEWEVRGMVTPRRQALTIHNAESLRAMSGFGYAQMGGSCPLRRRG